MRALLVLLMMATAASAQITPKPLPDPMYQVGEYVSLWNHTGQPTSTTRTNIDYWMLEFATEAGKSYNHVGEFMTAFMDLQELPPGVTGAGNWQFGRGANTTFYDPSTQTLLAAGVTNFLWTQNNYTWQSGFNAAECVTTPSSCDVEWLRFVDWAHGESPFMPVYSFVGWPEPPVGGGAYGQDWTTFWEWLEDDGTGAYSEYFYDGYDYVVANSPNANFKLIPAGTALAKLREPGKALNGVDEGTIFVDGAPHGSEEWYFLCAMVVYMVTYGEQPPASYTVPVDIADYVRLNYADIRTDLWTDLTTNYLDSNGQSMVFFQEEIPLGPTYGVNSSGYGYSASVYPFANLAKQSGFYSTTISTGTPFNDGRAFPTTDADGYPTSLDTDQMVRIAFNDPAGNAPAHPGPWGEYRITYDGTATTLNVVNATVNSSSAGQIDITVPSNSQWEIQYHGISAGTHFRNLKVLPLNGGICSSAPTVRVSGSGDCSGDYVAFTSGNVMFLPEHMAVIDQYEGYRFFEWTGANCSALVNWADRMTLTDVTWPRPGWDGSGVPVEAIVEWMTKMPNKVYWINIPSAASDDYVTQYATTIHASKPADTKVYVEYTNEHWNGGIFSTGPDCPLGQVTHLTSLQTARGLNNIQEAFAERTQEVMQLWKAAVGNDLDYRYVMGGEIGDQNITTETLSHRFAYLNVDAVAFGVYFGSGGLTHVCGDIATSFTNLDAARASVDGELAGQLALAQSNWGIKTVAYEGGQHLDYFDEGNTCSPPGILTDMQRDSRMNDIYDTHLANWESSGAGVYMTTSAYSLYSADGEGGGSWGNQEDWNDTDAQRVTAIRDAIAGAAPATIAYPRMTGGSISGGQLN